MPSRRRVLATLGATLLAGCGTTAPGTQTSTTRTSARSDPPTATASSSTPSTSSSTATSEPTTPTPSIETITATRSFVFRFATVHHLAYTSPDTTFVFARASAQVDRNEYALVAGDRERDARTTVGDQEVSSLVEGVPEGDGTLLAFEIEGAVAPADATIQGPSGATAVPATVRETLREPPACTVQGFDAPDMAHRHGEVTVSLSVRNAGGTTGVFRANVGSTELSGQPVSTVEVPAETTRTVDYSVNLFGDGDTETIRCAWGVDSRERTIELTD